MSKVLIVDDAYSMRNLIKKALKEAGHEIVGEAKNGLEGIEMFEKFQPDIVTMDIKMPDISGIETTKRIKKKFPNAIIVAVTGNNLESIKEEMLLAGAVDYLRKPFQPAFLLQKIDKALETLELQVDIGIHNLVESDGNDVAIEADSLERVVVKTTSPEEVLDDDMVIELSNESDIQNVTPFVIESEEDVFEFPTDYPLEEEIEKHAFQVDSPAIEELVDDEDEEEVVDLIIHSETESPPTPLSHSVIPSSSIEDMKNISLSFDDIDTVRKYAQIKPEPFDSPIRIRPPKTDFGKPSQFESDNEEVEDDDFILDTNEVHHSKREKNNRLFGFVKKLFKP